MATKIKPLIALAIETDIMDGLNDLWLAGWRTGVND
jgi:hypothetical protein